MNTDKRALRMQVSAEETRKSQAARVELEHQREELALRRQRQKLLLKEERRQSRETENQRRRLKRQQARQRLAGRIQKLMPTIGQRALITGPIVAPMTVAWIGQISFAMETLGWIFVGAVIFAAAWELTTAFSGWMYHQARKSGDRGTLFRVATWIFASSAGAMNYWHACPVIAERLNVQTVRHHIDLSPTPKAVSYGAMSLVGIALWELYSSLIHRQHLRAKGIVASPRPRFGILRWLRFSRITWHAWSLAVRYGIQTVDEAWTAAVDEVERIDRDRAAKRKRRRLAKDNRPEVRVTIVRTIDHTVAPTSGLRIYRVNSLGATYDRPSVAPDGGPRALVGQGHSGAIPAEPQRAISAGATDSDGPATDAPVGPAPAEKVAPGPDSSTVVDFAPRGETQAAMRAHWDGCIAEGRIPSGADLNRAVAKDPKYSLGKKYAKQWRQELPEAFVEAVEAGRTEEAREIAAGFCGADREAVAR